MSTNHGPDSGFENDPPSHLFLMRVWLCAEALNDGEGWRGWIQHTTTGEAHAFWSCAELRRAVRQMVTGQRPGGSG